MTKVPRKGNIVMERAMNLRLSDSPEADDEFRARVRFSRECHNWTGLLDHDGYGKFWVDGHYVAAHRFAYERRLGPIPEGLEIDHLCFNRKCVNSKHLEPVTHKENKVRAANFRSGGNCVHRLALKRSRDTLGFGSLTR